MNGISLNRFIGGSPIGVFVRLAVLSLILGVVLSALGVSPFDIVDGLRALVLRVFNLGFDTVGIVWRYFLLGAVVVFPVWLVLRFLKAGRRGTEF